MGPRSTAPFIDMLPCACQEQYDAQSDIDFPEMHIISLPTPFWPGREINHADMIQALRYGIIQLKRAGVGLIIVTCNLAHGYINEMMDESGGIPLLHIADCALATLQDSARRVVVLATEPTLDAGFYQSRLHNSDRVSVNSPLIRSMFTALFSQIKANGFENENVIQHWTALLSSTKAVSADAILVACTDISPLITLCPASVDMVDTAKSLADATICHYLRLKKEHG